MKEVTAVLKALRRRWITVLVCTVLGLAAAVGYGLLRVDQYESVATLAVSTNAAEQTASSAYQSSMAAHQRVSTYAQLVTHSDVLPRVAAESGGEFTVAELEDSVSATGRDDTVLIELRAADEDPVRAQRMTELTAVALGEMVEEIETPPGTAVPMAYLTLVEQPTQPPGPTGMPLWLLSLVGLFLGLVAGLMVALIRDYFDRTVRDAGSVVEIAGTDPLGVLYEETRKDRELVEAGAPAGTGGRINMEAFRHIRTNLGFVEGDQPPQVLLVTSSVPEEGKTYTSANTAQVLAEAGHRVVLVDGDLRMMGKGSVLRGPDRTGLTDVLTGGLGVDDVVQTYAEGVDLLPAGPAPANPSEILGSQAMKDMLAELRRRYDFVIVDSPAVLPVTDPLVLSTLCDAVVFVSRVGLVKTGQIEAAMGLLRNSGTRAAGLVINGVRESDSSQVMGIRRSNSGAAAFSI